MLTNHPGAIGAGEPYDKDTSDNVGDPLTGLSQLYLARASAQQNDGTKARAAYQEFLALCKDGDPDIPILKDPKTEYAKL